MDLERLKREWVNPASQNGKIQAEIWDARAGEYGEKEIPDRENNDFLKDLWGKVGIQKEMEVLDIGCGNGLYSMALAPYVKEAVGVDVSPKMIERGIKRIGELSLKNVELHVLDWVGADLKGMGFEERFDLVFAHMTPAVCDYRTLDLMNRCSRKKCVMVKPARRQDAVLDQAFGAAGITGQKEQLDEIIPNTFTYLWLKGYEPEIWYRKEIWKSVKPREEMEKWCLNRAKIQKELREEEEEKIREYVKAVSIDGYVEETVTTSIVTIYWQV